METLEIRLWSAGDGAIRMHFLQIAESLRCKSFTGFFNGIKFFSSECPQFMSSHKVLAIYLYGMSQELDYRTVSTSVTDVDVEMERIIGAFTELCKEHKITFICNSEIKKAEPEDLFW